MLVGALVPCTPTLPTLRPSQYAPSGLLGPGGTLSGSHRPARRASSRIESGTSHVGLTSFAAIENSPSGVFQSRRPTATGYALRPELVVAKSIRCGTLTIRVTPAGTGGAMWRLSIESVSPTRSGASTGRPLSRAMVAESTPKRDPKDRSVSPRTTVTACNCPVSVCAGSAVANPHSSAETMTSVLMVTPHGCLPPPHAAPPRRLSNRTVHGSRSQFLEWCPGRYH